MIVVHPYVIVAMAALYTIEYVYRFIRIRPRNYIYLGKAMARGILTGIYMWVWLTNPSEAMKMILIRWSIAMLLGVDLFYIAQEHLMRKVLCK